MHNSTSYILRVSGNWTNDGTFNRGVGTVEFNGTNALQKITGTSSTDFYVLRVDKGSDDNILDAIAQITLNAAVDAPLALISGTFRLSNAAVQSPLLQQTASLLPTHWVSTNVFGLAPAP